MNFDAIKKQEKCTKKNAIISKKIHYKFLKIFYHILIAQFKTDLCMYNILI
jgi:hypothetical protein